MTELIGTEAGRMTTDTAGAASTAQITAAALDYVEGWFDGDAERMRRALHPALVKRSIDRDEAGGERLETLTADQMIRATGEGIGRTRDPGDRQIAVSVDHVDAGIATARCVCALYVDYLQLARTEAGWTIVNVLWRRR